MRFVLILFLLLCGPAGARELKLATWNLEWLTARNASALELPADQRPKQPEDVALLARYAAELDADVIAIQEVDGRAAAGLVFPPDRYAVHMTRDHLVQKVGIVVRRGIHFTVNPDVTSLSPPELHLRSGADITLDLPGSPLRVLAVHLKTGCRESPLIRTHRHACQELAEQVPGLAEWIGARRAEGTPFVVMGDFNRWLEGNDQLLAAMEKAAPLVQATAGVASPCWGGERFIDHILAGGAAREWLETGTLRVLVFRETAPEWKERLSDHCPVSVRFRVPD